jgi:hypothetical protein
MNVLAEVVAHRKTLGCGLTGQSETNNKNNNLPTKKSKVRKSLYTPLAVPIRLSIGRENMLSLLVDLLRISGQRSHVIAFRDSEGECRERAKISLLSSPVAEKS